MTINTSLEAYTTEEALLDRAIASERGIKIKLDYTAAIYLRNRLNYCRTMHRQENKKIFPEDEYMHGKSHYDELVIRVTAYGVEIEKPAPIDGFEIEEL